MNIHPLFLAAFGPLGTPELIIILILGVIMLGFTVLPFWFICKKAGLSPWLCLIGIIPLSGLLLPLVIALIDWPVLKTTCLPATQETNPS
jgi:hypothetical protein